MTKGEFGLGAAKIISDATRGYRPAEASDLHDVTGHHRYYGSSACGDSEGSVIDRTGRTSAF
jgi:hypothetical protein